MRTEHTTTQFSPDPISILAKLSPEDREQLISALSVAYDEAYKEGWRRGWEDCTQAWEDFRQSLYQSYLLRQPITGRGQ